jgi:hypothetical protein
MAAGNTVHPILSALGIAHDDFAALDDEILDAKPMRLHQPQAAAIKQIRDQPGCAVELRQYRTHLGGAQYHGQPLGPRCPGDVLQPGQLDVEHVPVKKQQRLQRLILS